MARYQVQFKAFKTGEWHTKTDTDHFNSARSVFLVDAMGRSARIIEDGSIIEENEGDVGEYEKYGQEP